MNITFLETDKLKDISSDILLPNGKMKLLSYKEYEKYPHPDLQFFCHQYGRYGIPTLELIQYLRSKIGHKYAIEIGSGNGDLGYHLGIHMTDSKQQSQPKIKKWYEMHGQPTIKYPEDVEKIEALDAVKKYNPQVVIASWVTPYSPWKVSYSSNPCGVQENRILSLVETYILIGNLDVHGDRPLLKRKNTVINEPFIISRASNPEKNRIFLWKKEND